MIETFDYLRTDHDGPGGEIGKYLSNNIFQCELQNSKFQDPMVSLFSNHPGLHNFIVEYE